MDPTRTSFVQREYRFDTEEDLSIKSIYPSSQELTFTTNLDEASANILANALFTELRTPAQGWRVEVEGIYRLEDFEGGPLRFILDMPLYQTDGRALKVFSIKTEWLKDRTILELRG